MKRKFELTDDTVHTDEGVTLYRIRATEDIPAHGVVAGDLGGFVESVDNLSGNGWVSDDARVYGNAWVYGNARVYGNAEVYGNAWVYGNARVYGEAWVQGEALVYGEARVYGEALVAGEALVYGEAQVSGKARIYGYAHLTEIRHVQQVIGIGSEDRTATFFRTLGGGHTLDIGCWSGTLDTLSEEVTRRREVCWEAEESTKDAWVAQYDALQVLCEATMKLWENE